MAPPLLSQTSLSLFSAKPTLSSPEHVPFPSLPTLSFFRVSCAFFSFSHTSVPFGNAKPLSHFTDTCLVWFGQLCLSSIYRRGGGELCGLGSTNNRKKKHRCAFFFARQRVGSQPTSTCPRLLETSSNSLIIIRAPSWRYSTPGAASHASHARQKKQKTKKKRENIRKTKKETAKLERVVVPNEVGLAAPLLMKHGTVQCARCWAPPPIIMVQDAISNETMPPRQGRARCE